MNSCDLIRRLHQHRLWVNSLLRTAASSLTAAQRHQPFPIGQGSVWQSLVHFYVAEFVWLEALEGNANPGLPAEILGDPLGSRLSDCPDDALKILTEMWTELEARWVDYLSRLTASALEDDVFKTKSGAQPKIILGTKRSDVLLHVCTHAHYTTAQVVNMLRSLGVTPLPDPMLISLARQPFADGQ